MSHRRRAPSAAELPRIARAAALGLAFAGAGLSCGDRAPTEPSGPLPVRATLSIRPTFQVAPAGGPSFDLRRVTGWAAAAGRTDTVRVDALFDGDSVSLVFDVRVLGESELFSVRLVAIDAGGDSVFAALDTLRVLAGVGATPAATLTLAYVAPDTAVRTLLLRPSDTTVAALASFPLRALGLDARGDTVRNVRVGWTARDLNAAAVSPSGVVSAHRFQRRTWMVGRTFTNLVDSVLVRVSAPIASVTASPGSASIARGDTLRLGAILRDSSGLAIDDRAATWTSLDPAVATVDAAGLVRALQHDATARVVATAAGRSDTAIVRTLPRPVDTVVVAGRTPVFVRPGSTLQLTASALDALDQANPDNPLGWISFDTTRVKVSSTGLVTGVGNGVATVAVGAGGRSTFFSVGVTNATVARVGVWPKTASLATGDTMPVVVAAFDPQDAVVLVIDDNVVWSALDPAVASVSPRGTVTAVAPGTARIVARFDGQADTATIAVGGPPVGLVQLSPRVGSLRRGETLRLTTTLLDRAGLPLPARPVSWSVSDPTVLAVDATGLVTGLRANASALVIAAAGNVADTASLSVLPQLLDSIVVTPRDPVFVLIGTTQQLTASPRDAAGQPNPDWPVSWFSSDTNVATVSSTGAVTAKSLGVAYVAALAANKRTIVRIGATPVPIAAVQLSPRNTQVQAGSTRQIDIVALDAQGAVVLTLPNVLLTWTSSDPTVASVSSTGLITAHRPGTVTVAGSSLGLSDQVTVTVTP